MTLFALFVLSAILDWIGAFRNKRTLIYIFKPMTLILLIAWFLTKKSDISSPMGTLFLIGLLLSLAGDVLLMIPRDQFLLGLIAFLLAHVAYIAGFNADGILLTPRTLAIVVLIAIIIIPIFRLLAKNLRASDRSALQIPIVLYVVVLSLMTWSASTTLFRPEWTGQSGLSAAGGGWLFLVSDGVLGWDRFVKPVPQGRLIVHTTYHLAQALIILGVIFR